jgi:hypothetical protein
MDDVHITDEYNFNPNVPGAEQTVYNSTIFLMNGKTLETITTSNIPIVTVGALTDRTEPRYAVYRASGEPVDADVALQVTGLKGMNCDGAGSITEVA